MSKQGSFANSQSDLGRPVDGRNQDFEEMQSHKDIGHPIQLIALVVSAFSGFLEKPAALSIVIGAILFTVGYVLVRLPILSQLYRSDGLKVGLAYMYLLIGHAALAGALYGIGWLFH